MKVRQIAKTVWSKNYRRFIFCAVVASIYGYVSIPSFHGANAIAIIPLGVAALWIPDVVGEALFAWLKNRTICARPPGAAEFLMYLVFPRKHREATVGDLNEDFATSLVPRFGRPLAGVWYWWKAIQLSAMYAYLNAAVPLFEKIVVPVARRAWRPLLTILSGIVANKLGLIDAVGTAINKHLR